MYFKSTFTSLILYFLAGYEVINDLSDSMITKSFKRTDENTLFLAFKFLTVNVVVTGASKGIGRAICRLLSEKQANLAICSRGISDLEALRDDILGHQPNLAA